MTLREVFSSIANAIRSKTGKTATIKPVDMATEIESIQTGGGDNKLSQFIDGSLTTITAEDLAGATKVRDYAFYRNSIENITLPDGVINIGSYAFRESYIKQIILPNTLVSINNYAFYSCSGLTQITIPSNVTSIGSGALDIGSSTFKATITMKPTTPPTIASSTFTANAINKIIVPVGCGNTYKSATNWSNFADYIEEATA